MKTRTLIILTLAIAVVAGIAVVLLRLDGGERRVMVEKLPWAVQGLPDGGIEVFGWSLGRTTLKQISDELGAVPEVGVFVGPGEAIAAEAYFGRVRLGILEARLVAGLDIDEAGLRAMADRGIKSKPMPSGARRLELLESDLRVAYLSPVATLSYIPYADYDSTLIERRFGEAAERIELTQNAAYWLYPEMGLAILVDDEGREVFEYVDPRAFANLRARVIERSPAVRAQ